MLPHLRTISVCSFKRTQTIIRNPDPFILRTTRETRKMGKAIPTKIKPYPGLVKAWKARQGSPGRSYDPPGKKRSPRHSSRPKRKKRRSMTTGYGKINKKPFRRGSRGGTYWSGGRTPRYDPRDFGRRTKKRAKDKFTQIWQKFEKKINPIATLLGFFGILLGVGNQSFQAWCGRGYDPKEYFTKGIPMEVKNLFGMEGTWRDPLRYLEYKFLNPESHWSPPFIVSLVTYALCKLGILDLGLSILTNKSKKIIAPIQKLSGGVLLASTVGALILPGSDGYNPTSAPSRGGSSGNPTHSDSSMWS